MLRWSILAVLLTCAWDAAAADKWDLLERLTEASGGQLAARASDLARNQRKETSELALDLIVFRWASAASGMPGDVANAGSVISSLTAALSDPTVTWAAQFYSVSTDPARPSVLPPQFEERVTRLSELRREYGLALDYAETSPVAAVNALTACLELCTKLRLDLCEALVMAQLGDHYFANMSRYREAEGCYLRAAWTFRTYDCIQSSAIIYDDCGALNEAMGRYPAAAENHTLAARQWMALAGSGQSAQRFLLKAGQAYMRAGDSMMAAGEVEKALELMTERGLKQIRAYAHASKSYAELIGGLISVARIYRERGSARKSLDLLEEARKACGSQNDPLLTARVYGEIAEAYKAADQPAAAQDAAKQRVGALESAAAAGADALAALGKVQPDGKRAQALFTEVSRGAEALSLLGNAARAEETWRKAAEACARLGLAAERATALRSLANVLESENRPADALVARLDAITTAMQASRKVLARDIGLELAQGLVEAGDLNNALEAFRDLAPIFEDSGDVKGAAAVLENRGILLASHGKHQDAVRDLRDAQVRYANQVGDPWAAGAAALKLAVSMSASGDRNGAQRALESALKDIEIRYSSENLDPNVDAKRGAVLMDLYAALVARYVHDGREEEASKLLGKARRYLWLSTLIDRLAKDADPAIAAFAAGINTASEPDPGGPAGVPGTNRVLGDTWPSFLGACTLLEEQDQSSYNALPIRPREFYSWRNALPKNGVVVEYMPAGQSVYAFVCGYERSVCRELGVRPDAVERYISLLRKVLKSREDSLSADIRVPPVDDWREASFLEIKEPLAALYRLLIEPIRHDLEGRQLLMFALPTGFAGLPMHALIAPGDGPPRFMVQDYEIGYLGQGMLTNLVSKDSRGIDPSTDRLAVFANPQGNLPGAEEESRILKSVYFNSQHYLRDKANVAAFMDECKKAGILHIAAHHRIDPNPTRFELMLAPSDGMFGKVGIAELTQIPNPNLQLVVLSACDSISSSDPISTGPARAAELFSMAGARSVLGGLWKVSDDAAAKIMGDFYRTLARGRSRTEALRSAQIKAIEDARFANPFYWACFAVYGNPW